MASGARARTKGVVPSRISFSKTSAPSGSVSMVYCTTFGVGGASGTFSMGFGSGGFGSGFATMTSACTVSSPFSSTTAPPAAAASSTSPNTTKGSFERAGGAMESSATTACAPVGGATGCVAAMGAPVAVTRMAETVCGVAVCGKRPEAVAGASFAPTFRCACSVSSTLTTSSSVCGRAFGSFSSILKTRSCSAAGRVAVTSGGNGGAGSVTCFTIKMLAVSPAKVGLPVSIS